MAHTHGSSFLASPVTGSYTWTLFCFMVHFLIPGTPED